VDLTWTVLDVTDCLERTRRILLGDDVSMEPVAKIATPLDAEPKCLGLQRANGDEDDE